MTPFNTLVLALLGLLVAGQGVLLYQVQAVKAGPAATPMAMAAPLSGTPLAPQNVAFMATGRVIGIAAARLEIEGFAPPGAKAAKSDVFALVPETKILRNAGVKSEEERKADIAEFQKTLAAHRPEDGPLPPPLMERQVSAKPDDIKPGDLVTVSWKHGKEKETRQAITVTLMRTEGAGAPPTGIPKLPRPQLPGPPPAVQEQ